MCTGLDVTIRVGIVASLPFAKIFIPLHWGIILAKGQLDTIHYDSAPRPQKSCVVNPSVGTVDS